MRPDASLSLGSKDIFCCAPVSRLEGDNEDNKLKTTYAAVESKASSGNASKGSTISAWTSKGSITTLEERHTTAVSIDVTYLMLGLTQSASIGAVPRSSDFCTCVFAEYSPHRRRKRYMYGPQRNS